MKCRTHYQTEVKMSTFRSKEIFQKLLGDAHFLPPQFHEHIVLPMLHSIVMSLTLVSSANDFLLSIRVNTIHACASYSMMMSALVWTTVYWYIFKNRQQFYSIMSDTEKLIDQRA